MALAPGGDRLFQAVTMATSVLHPGLAWRIFVSAWRIHCMSERLQLVIPKVRHSEGLNTPKVRYFEGSLFRRSVIPKFRNSEGPLFRRFDIPKMK